MFVHISGANFLAKNSCSKWNRYRFLRVICRRLYRYLGEKSAKSVCQCKSSEAVEGINTYPWPYSDADFAKWPEDVGALVSDPAGMVIKHATSYCAWKIREATGAWPIKKVIPTNEKHALEIAQRERPGDAKYWQEFLYAQGYTEVCKKPQNGRRYVGIGSNYGKWGLVVWFEKEGRNPDSVMITAYIDKQFEYKQVSAKDYIWVEIT